MRIWKSAMAYCSMGRIENNQACFKDMGRGIVYLPVYYKNGIQIFASDPFLLQEDGQIRSLTVKIRKNA